MNKVTLIVLALIDGTLLPVPAGLNAKIGRAISCIASASLISLVVCAVSGLGYVVFAFDLIVLGQMSICLVLEHYSTTLDMLSQPITVCRLFSDHSKILGR